jgi:protein-S-isoprenylcysteine O-methyltransferase Ste14
MYLGMACLHVAIAFALGSLAALLLLIPALVIIDRMVIQREEIYLERRFGRPYLDYKARVRRWI